MRIFLSTNCWVHKNSKTFKNICVMFAIFCKQNVLSHAFCKFSSLESAYYEAVGGGVLENQ